jgi:hypothetical protein
MVTEIRVNVQLPCRSNAGLVAEVLPGNRSLAGATHTQDSDLAARDKKEQAVLSPAARFEQELANCVPNGGRLGRQAAPFRILGQGRSGLQKSAIPSPCTGRGSPRKPKVDGVSVFFRTPQNDDSVHQTSGESECRWQNL